MGNKEALLNQLPEADRERLRPHFRNADKRVMDRAEREMILYMKTNRMNAGPRTIEEVLQHVQKSSVSKAKKWLWDDKDQMVKDPMFYQYISEYIMYGFDCNWIEYYTEADKEELLPLEKIEQGKGRTFIYQGAYQWFVDSIFMGKLNEKLEDTPICRSGWTPSGGGVDRIISEVYEKFGSKFNSVKGDANKFDFSQFIDDVNARRRIAQSLYDGSEFGKRQIYQSYARQARKYIKLSCGCIVHLGEEHAIQPSGIFDTTCGNSCRHFRVVIYCLLKCGAKDINDILDNSLLYICSDDHLFFFRQGWQPGEVFKDYDVRSALYAEGGILLKKQDDLVTESCVKGQRWAGIMLNDNGNHVYAKDKVLASANYKNIVGLNSQQYYEKLISLQLLMANDKATFDKMDNFISLLYPNKPRLLREKAMKWFSGREGLELQGLVSITDKQLETRLFRPDYVRKEYGPRWWRYNEDNGDLSMPFQNDDSDDELENDIANGVVWDESGSLMSIEGPVYRRFGDPFWLLPWWQQLKGAFMYSRFLSGMIRVALGSLTLDQEFVDFCLEQEQEINANFSFNWQLIFLHEETTREEFLESCESWYRHFQINYLNYTAFSCNWWEHLGPTGNLTLDMFQQYYAPYYQGMYNFVCEAHYLSFESAYVNPLEIDDIELQGFEQPISNTPTQDVKEPSKEDIMNNRVPVVDGLVHYDTCLGKTPCMCMFRPTAVKSEEGIKIDEMARQNKNGAGKSKGAASAKEVKKVAREAKKVAKTEQRLVRLVKATHIANPKETRKQRRLIVKPARGQKFNPYVHCLLDPDAFPAKYPDKFCEDTATWVLKIEEEIPITTVQSPTGEFYGVVYPSMRDTLLMRNIGFDDTTGLPNFTGEYDYELEERKSKHTYSVNSKLIFDESPWKGIAEESNPFLNIGTANAPEYDYTTFDLTKRAPGSTPSFSGKNDEILLENQSGAWSIFFNDNATPTPTKTAIASSSTVGCTSATPNIAGGATRAWFTYESNVSTNVRIKRCKLSMYFPQLAGSQRGMYYNNKSIDKAVAIADAYRVVGQTLLVSYVGDVTKEGGRIFGYFYNGVTDIKENHLDAAAKVATRKGAYSGPLRDGLWMHWKPCKELDMQFRDPDDSLPANIPIMLFAGNAQEPATRIRVRVTTCYEYISNEDVASTSKSPVYPEQITEAERMLRNFPQVMENPLHYEQVRQFFENISNKFKGMWERYSPYVKTGVSIAQMAAPLLLA